MSRCTSLLRTRVPAQVCNSFERELCRDFGRKSESWSRQWTDVRILGKSLEHYIDLLLKTSAQNLFHKNLRAASASCRHDHERWKCARAGEECGPIILYSATIRQQQRKMETQKN